MNLEHFKYKYVALLRCRSWGIWPEEMRIASKGIEYSFDQDNKDSMVVSIHLVTYERRPRPENETAKPCIKYNSPIVSCGKMETGYWVGNQVLKAPEDKLEISFDHRGPLQGEVDIQLHIGSTAPLESKDAIHFLDSISFSVISYLNILFDECLIPVAPLQIRTLVKDCNQFNNNIKIFCKNRPNITKEDLEMGLARYTKMRTLSTPENERTIDVAMKRFLSAQKEEDLIDKYCDLWEVCEFISVGTKAKGGKVGQISQCLTNHINASGVEIKKSTIETLLDIKGLYDIRSSLVHNALDNPDLVNEKIYLLNEIALELIKYKTGLPYKGSPLIDKAITKPLQR